MKERSCSKHNNKELFDILSYLTNVQSKSDDSLCGLHLPGFTIYRPNIDIWWSVEVNENTDIIITIDLKEN